MSNEDNIIDAEIVENLPAVQQEHPWNPEPLEPSPLRTEQLESNQARRCTAHSSRTGEQCRKWAVLGTEPGVCATHGASAPQVKRKARERVEMASNRLMGKLIEFAFDDTKPPATQLDAIKDSLNRAGLRPPAEVVLSQGEAPWQEVFDEISTASRAESRAARGAETLPANRTEEGLGGKSFTQGDGPNQPDHQPEPGGGRESFVCADTYGEYDEPHWASQSDSQARPQRVDRERGNQGAERHITGDDALSVAAQLARGQRAIESGHKKYLRP